MPSVLTRNHRRELTTLTGLAEKDLSALWREFDRVDGARDLLMDTLPRLVTIYGAAAATLAADYYDDLREQAGARGRFTAIPAEPAGAEATEVLARVAVGPLFGAEPNFAAALTLASGGLQRHIANAGRETLRFSSIQDRAAEGWRRVGVGECEWCQQYLDGEVHYVEGYDFDAHDHCRCNVEPVFG